IASRAYKEGTGARALARILEVSLIPFERVLPSMEINHLAITEELINDPEGYLKSLLANPLDDKWRKAYESALKDEKERMIQFLENKTHLKKGLSFELTSSRLNLLFSLYKSEDIEFSHAIEELNYLYKQIKAYLNTFSKRNQIQAIFTEDAIDYILEEVLKRDIGVFSFCERSLSKLEYTIALLKETTGKEQFFITKKAFTEQDKFLEELLRN
ncbi:MAG: ATPase, partial [Caldimicrobium sp.]